MKTIDIEFALESMRRAVEKKGADYVYKPPAGNSCVYFNKDGSPSCIVGHVFADAGVDPDDFLLPGPGRTRSSNSCRITILDLDGVGVQIDDATRRALDAAQYAQDRGVTWAGALADAEMRAEQVR